MSAPSMGHTAAVLAGGVAVGVGLAAAGGSAAAPLAAVTILLGIALVVTVPVPWGGSVPLGYALAIALPAVMPYDRYALVAACAGVLVAATRVGNTAGGGPATVARVPVGLIVAGVAGGTVSALLPDAGVLLPSVAAVAALVPVDAALARVADGDAHGIEVKSSVPVYLTLACGGVLVAVAVDNDAVGVQMAAIAAFPLLITRFSFQRSAHAHETLRQTVQALGLVPELAGLTPLGHSERSAWYGAALARQLGFDRLSSQRIVTACRLHHLGTVPFDPDDPAAPALEAPSPDAVAAQCGLILREAGFPSDVADLIEAAAAGTIDRPAPTLDAAVVRVVSAFDEAVGDDAAAVDRGLALVSATALDRHTRRAAAGLLELVAVSPEVVPDAVAAGDRFREAASGLDLDALMTSGVGGEILPFVRRR